MFHAGKQLTHIPLSYCMICWDKCVLKSTTTTPIQTFKRLSSFFPPVLMTDICWRCETCNVLPLLCSFSKQLSLRMTPSTLRTRRTLSMSCSNHPVRTSCVTRQNKRLSSLSLQYCLITWLTGTAISDIYTIRRGINLFRNRSLSNSIQLLIVEINLTGLPYCQTGPRLET